MPSPSPMARYRQGRLYLRNGHFRRAWGVARMFRREGRRSGRPETYVLGLLLSADLAADETRYRRAIHWARRGLGMAGPHRGLALGILARVCLHAGEARLALLHARRAFFLLRRRDQMEDAGLALFNFAAALASMGESARAAKALEKVLSFAGRHGVPFVEGLALYFKGVEAMRIGRFGDARQHFERALDRLPDSPLNNNRMQCQARLALVLARCGDRERALAISAQVRESIMIRRGAQFATRIERNHVEILIELEDYDRALLLLESLSAQTASSYDVVETNVLRAELHLRLGEAELARRCLARSRQESEAKRLKGELPCLPVAEARSMLMEGRVENAFQLTDRVLEGARRTGNVDLERQALTVMAGVFFHRGDLLSALKYLGEAEAIAEKMEIRPELARLHIHLAGLQNLAGNQAMVRMHLLKAGDLIRGIDLPVTGYVLNQCHRRLSMLPLSDGRASPSAELGSFQRQEARRIIERYGFKDRRRFRISSQGSSYDMAGEEMERFLRQSRGVLFDREIDMVYALHPARPPLPLAAGTVCGTLLRHLMLSYPHPLSETKLWRIGWDTPYRSMSQIQCLRANLSRLRAAIRKAGLPNPVHRNGDGYRLSDEIAWIIVQPASPSAGPLTPRQEWLYQYLNVHPSITTAEACRHLKVSAPTAFYDFKALMGKNLIRRQGKGRATHYVISSSGE